MKPVLYRDPWLSGLENLFSDNEYSRTSIYPAVDIAENDHGYYLQVDLPGMSKDNINLTLENDVLNLSGARESTPSQEENSWHRIERRSGSFQRSFRFNKAVNPDGVRAEFKLGVLHIHVPKQEQAKNRVIAITGEGEVQANPAT